MWEVIEFFGLLRNYFGFSFHLKLKELLNSFK